MKLKFFFIAILIVTLAVPSTDMQIFSIAFAQPSDKSFKGAEAPFIPPPESERIPKAPPSDGISINDIPPVGLGVTEEEEKDGGRRRKRARNCGKIPADGSGRKSKQKAGCGGR